MPRTNDQVAAIARGGYILKDCADPQAILIATGSDVELATLAADELASKGIQVRVVSMPCAEIFSAQDADYRDAVLPPAVRARVAVEALHADYWYKFVGLDGRVVGMTSFGESAPGDVLMKEFGFTVENVVANVMDAIG
jgi:transketolase